ncbi:RsfA family transcriptional regulator [Gracilibacillus alcaliphilus]|uniref:RsfA family transcriptional regulator n=1 Tax=Gracilibacillus alcaliphilus TaxID=1401441 RepID=UPI00195CD2C8|nr:RsfA family transcription factor [Gracilibacillus alcaliphilus]
MQGIRQDAWSPNEDKLLAETVLQYIREGKTQLTAFREVGEKLSRTSAACGFRWNATLRKQYEEAIQLAKQERKQVSYTVDQETISAQTVQPNIHDVLETLERMQKYYNSLNEQQELQNVVKQNQQLQAKLSKYQAFHQSVKKAMDSLEE